MDDRADADDLFLSMDETFHFCDHLCFHCKQFTLKSLAQPSSSVEVEAIVGLNLQRFTETADNVRHDLEELHENALVLQKTSIWDYYSLCRLLDIANGVPFQGYLNDHVINLYLDLLRKHVSDNVVIVSTYFFANLVPKIAIESESRSTSSKLGHVDHIRRFTKWWKKYRSDHSFTGENFHEVKHILVPIHYDAQKHWYDCFCLNVILKALNQTPF